MKKFLAVVFLISMFLFSVSTFAAETAITVGAPVPIPAVKPGDVKDFKITEPGTIVGCPMMQGGQGMINGNCQMMQGGKVLMTNNPQNGNKFYKKFRGNQNNNQCNMGRPKIFMWIGMGIKFLTCLLFWILLIVLLIMMIRWALKPHHMMHCFKNNSALDILNERLAKGEITTEQYDELKAKLS